MANQETDAAECVTEDDEVCEDGDETCEDGDESCEDGDEQDVVVLDKEQHDGGSLGNGQMLEDVDQEELDDARFNLSCTGPPTKMRKTK